MNAYTTDISKLKGMGSISGTEPGVYTLYVYDIDYDGGIPSSPAIIIDGITITEAILPSSLNMDSSRDYLCEWNSLIIVIRCISCIDTSSCTQLVSTTTATTTINTTTTISICNESSESNTRSLTQVATIGGKNKIMCTVLLATYKCILLILYMYTINTMHLTYDIQYMQH